MREKSITLYGQTPFTQILIIANIFSAFQEIVSSE